MQVFIEPKVFAASPRQMALRSGEECLCNSVETFTTVYSKVDKRKRSGVGRYAAADQKGIPQKKCYAFYAAA